MIGRLKHGVALATAAGVLTLAGSALAAGTASAAQYHINSGTASGPATPIGTTYTATSSNISFRTSTNGLLSSCTSSTLAGATDAIVSGGPSAGLTVTPTGSSFTGCTVTATGTGITVTPVGTWQVTPTSGTSSPFGGTVTNVSVKVACGSTSETFSGTLSGTETNASPTYISLSAAGPLTASAGVCALPKSVYVTGTYTLATVNGSAVTTGSGGSNFILSYS